MQKRSLILDGEMVVMFLDLLPIENVQSINESLEKFKKGESPPGVKYKLFSRKIDYSELYNGIIKIFPPYEDIRYEFAENEIIKNYFAFGYNDLFIICDVKKVGKTKIIEDLAVFKEKNPKVSEEKKLEFANFLFRFCKKYNLIILDEIDHEIITCSSVSEIISYLKN